jgi:hypothetical protein
MNVSELKSNEVLMIVRSHDAHFDTFEIELHNNMPCEGQRSLVPAILLPALTREYGEPQEFVGRQFIVQLP